MTQPTLDDEIDSGETCEEVAAMETGTLQFAIQRPSGAFTSIELAMKTLTNDLNCEHCSNGGFQTSLGHLRGLGQSSPSRKISIKRKFYDMAFILKVLVNLLKTCFPIHLQD